jgi:hypothetical protein
MRLSALLLFLAGCASDVLPLEGQTGGKDAGLLDTGLLDSGSEVELVQLDQLCSNVTAFHGKRIRIEEAPSPSYSFTAVACTPQCCNAGTISYQYVCSDARDDLIELEGGASFDTVFGEVVEPSQTNPQLQHLIRQARTKFGCAGQQCYEVCVPAEVQSLTSVTGVLEHQSGDRHSTLIVESVTF